MRCAGPALTIMVRTSRRAWSERVARAPRDFGQLLREKVACAAAVADQYGRLSGRTRWASAGAGLGHETRPTSSQLAPAHSAWPSARTRMASSPLLVKYTGSRA